MTEVTNPIEANEAAADSAAAKKATEYTTVTLTDGREAKFAGKRKLNREVILDDGKPVGVRFDYVNGATHTVRFKDLDEATCLLLLAHGVSQKVGDESSGEKDVDDVVEAHSNMIDRLKKGEFYTARQAGDSYAGASVVVKAIAEVTGKSADEVKAFINKKLDAAKERGEKLTRAELYASFRNPESKTGQVIARLEQDKAKKAQKFNSDDLIAEAMAG